MDLRPKCENENDKVSRGKQDYLHDLRVEVDKSFLDKTQK